MFQQAAAQRLVHYWNQKVELWGEERAFRPITVHDFVGQDRDALEKGGLRVLPSRDSAGRAIVVIDRTRFDQSVAGRTSMVRLQCLDGGVLSRFLHLRSFDSSGTCTMSLSKTLKSRGMESCT